MKFRQKKLSVLGSIDSIWYMSIVHFLGKWIFSYSRGT